MMNFINTVLGIPIDHVQIAYHVLGLMLFGYIGLRAIVRKEADLFDFLLMWMMVMTWISIKLFDIMKGV